MWKKFERAIDKTIQSRVRRAKQKVKTVCIIISYMLAFTVLFEFFYYAKRGLLYLLK